MTPVRRIVAYTDGACSGNPGPGGWAVVIPPTALSTDATPTTLHGHADHTTNNRMEITAAIMAVEVLDHLGIAGELTVRTDSQLVVKGMNEWLKGWLKNGWKTSKKTAVINRDLWERLDALCRTRKVKFEWVKGHAGHKWNELTDELAVKGCRDPGATGMARLVAGSEAVLESAGG